MQPICLWPHQNCSIHLYTLRAQEHPPHELFLKWSSIRALEAIWLINGISGISVLLVASLKLHCKPSCLIFREKRMCFKSKWQLFLIKLKPNLPLKFVTKNHSHSSLQNHIQYPAANIFKISITIFYNLIYILPDFVSLLPGYRDKVVKFLVLFFQHHSRHSRERGCVVSAGKKLGLETKFAIFIWFSLGRGS